MAPETSVMFVGGCSRVFMSELVSSSENGFWRGMRRKHTCSLYPVVRCSVCFEVRPLSNLKLQMLGEGELPNQDLGQGSLLTVLTPSVLGSVSSVFQLFLSSSESHMPSLVCLTCWSADQLCLSKQGQRAEGRLASLSWDGKRSLGKGIEECKCLLCDLCLLCRHVAGSYIVSGPQQSIF